MNTKFLVLGTAVALFAAGMITMKSHAADTAETAPHRQFGHGALLQRIKEKLSLTDDQVTQIKAVFKDEQETLSGLLGRLHDARTDLRGAIQADQASEGAVRAASAKVAAVESDGAVERMKLFQKINPILTPEQRTKFSEMQSKLDSFIDNAIERLGEKGE